VAQVINDTISSWLVNWDSSNQYVTKYLVQLELDGKVIVSKETTATNYTLINVGVGDYTIKVYALNDNAISAAASVPLNIDIPSPPTLKVTLGSVDLEVEPKIIGSYFGVKFDLLMNTVNNFGSAVSRGTAGSFTLIGLQPETTYYLWARTISAAGTSGWTSVVQATTLDGQIYRDMVGELDPVDITEAKENIEELYENIDEITQSLIWEVSQSQEKTTDLGKSEAVTRVNEEAIADETKARAEQGTQLEASLETEKGRIDSTITRVDRVEVDTAGNAKAISFVQGTVYNPSTGMNATYTMASSAKTSADGASSATNILSNQVNNVNTGLSATNTLAQDASVKADNNATAVTILQSDINNIVGVKLADVTVTSGSNIVDVNSSEDISGFGSSSSFYVSEAGEDNTVLDVSSVNNSARTITLNSASTFSAANVTGVIKEGVSTTAELQLAVSGNTSDISTLKASFSLTGTIENDGTIRIVGIKGSIDANTSFLDFIGDKVRFLRPDGTPAIFFDLASGKYIFDGTIYAKDIEGDVVDSSSGQIAQVSFPIGDTANKQVLSFNVDPQPFARSVIIMPLRVEGSSGSTDLIRFSLLRGATAVDADNVNVGIGGGSANTITFSATLNANQGATFTLNAESANASKFQAVAGQAVVVQVFKQGSTISFN